MPQRVAMPRNTLRKIISNSWQNNGVIEIHKVMTVKAISLEMLSFLNSKLNEFYEFNFSNLEGEMYPRAKCINYS